MGPTDAALDLGLGCAGGKVPAIQAPFWVSRWTSGRARATGFPPTRRSDSAASAAGYGDRRGGLTYAPARRDGTTGQTAADQGGIPRRGSKDIGTVNRQRGYQSDMLSTVDAVFAFGDPDGGRVSPVRTAVEDINGDGLLDLILNFSMEEIVEAEALTGDSVDAVLTAGFGEEAIDLIGGDSVRIVPPKTAEPASVDLGGLDMEIVAPKKGGKKK